LAEGTVTNQDLDGRLDDLDTRFAVQKEIIRAQEVQISDLKTAVVALTKQVETVNDKSVTLKEDLLEKLSAFKIDITNTLDGYKAYNTRWYLGMMGTILISVLLLYLSGR